MPARILIVDDDADAQEMLKLTLEGAGYATTVAGNGEECLAQAHRSPPDLIVLDLILPDINGFTVCETLRRTDKTASVPIIMSTAIPGELPRATGLELGAAAYLRKPFSSEQILRVIRETLARTSKGQPNQPI
jgi:two-component system response regulator RpaA